MHFLPFKALVSTVVMCDEEGDEVFRSSDFFGGNKTTKPPGSEAERHWLR